MFNKCVWGRSLWGIQIEHVSCSINRAIGEQCSFRERGDALIKLTVRWVCEKYSSVKKKVYMALMDLEKANDKSR